MYCFQFNFKMLYIVQNCSNFKVKIFVVGFFGCIVVDWWALFEGICLKPNKSCFLWFIIWCAADPPEMLPLENGHVCVAFTLLPVSDGLTCVF